MRRVKIDLPQEFFFSCVIPVRITDLNYAGHVGNDTILSLVHEARLQYFRHFDYSELEFAGVGLIMADAVIEYKRELFYGDCVVAWVQAGAFSPVGFELFYKFEKEQDGRMVRVATIRTGMVCYDYQKKKLVNVPPEAVERLAGKTKG